MILAQAAIAAVLSAILPGPQMAHAAGHGNPDKTPHADVGNALPGTDSNAVVRHGIPKPKNKSQNSRDGRDGDKSGVLATAAPKAFGILKEPISTAADPTAANAGETSLRARGFSRNGNSVSIVSKPVSVETNISQKPASNTAAGKGVAAAPADSTTGIALDSTLGNATTGALSPGASGVYSIPASDGKQVGGNVFFSFSAFNLNFGETASFSAGNPPQAVHSVFARVTGGSPSNIDGTIQCTIPAANFYFINPAGVMVGLDAALDVPANFAISTADYIRFSDNTHFAATTPNSAALLSSAAPAAFGFLGNSPAAFGVIGGYVQPGDGNALLVVAGPIQLQGGALYCASGRVGVVSVASAGEVAFNSQSLAVTDISNAKRGAITLSTDAAISSTGSTGGAVSISCGTLSITGGSQVTADLSDSGAGTGGVTISATGSLVVSGSDEFGGDSHITAMAAQSATGKGGNVTISAGSLQLTNGAYIGTFTYGLTQAGTTTVAVSGNATISGIDSYGTISGIYADTYSTAQGGRGGNIVFSAGNLTLQDGAEISSSTQGYGNDGQITVTVGGTALITGQDSYQDISGIYATSSAAGKGGNAGNITLIADNLTLQHGGVISADTGSTGNGGNIAVQLSGTALISGEASSRSNSSISAASRASGKGGNAGSIALGAADLTLKAGGLISSATSSLGTGGDITVNISGSALITGEDSMHADSGIISVSFAATAGVRAGNAGNINFSTGNLTLQAGGAINSSTYSLGNAGNTTVHVAGTALFAGVDSQQNASGIYDTSSSSGQGGTAGNITFTAANLTMQDGGTIISSTAGAGNGGAISVGISGNLTLQNGGNINSATYGTGSSGDITVNVAGAALMFGEDAAKNTSGIYSNSNPAGKGGNAANILFSAASLTMQSGATISSGSYGQGNGGNITVNVSGPAIITGENNEHSDSGVFAVTEATGQGGNAGNIIFNASSLTLQAGGSISSSTYGLGAGGNITVNVAGSAFITGEDSLQTDSGIFSTSTSTGAGGNGGSIIFTAASLTLQAGGAINCVTLGQGNGGSISATISGLALITGEDSVHSDSGIFADSKSAGQGGDGGAIAVSAAALTLQVGGKISSSTLGLGNGGDIGVIVAGPVLIAGEDSAKSDSGIFATSSSTGPGGHGGSITLSAASLTMQAGAEINCLTLGLGNGGNIALTVPGDVLVSGEDSSHADSGVYADSNPAGQGGNAGNISLTAGTLTLQQGGTISSSTLGLGSGGDIVVTVTGAAIFSGEDSAQNDSGIFATSRSTGQGGVAGDIKFSAISLSLQGGGKINSSTAGLGAGGNVTVSVARDADLSGTDSTNGPSGIFVDSASPGEGGGAGGITITAASLNLTAGAQISSSTFGTGSGGGISINAGTISCTGVGPSASSGIDATTSEAQANYVGGRGGNVNVNATTSLSLTQGAIITASSSGFGGQAGDVMLHAGIILLDSGINTPSVAAPVPGGVFAKSTSPNGGGGSILLMADSVTVSNAAQIAASTIVSPTARGNITLDVSRNFAIKTGGLIDATTFGSADGGTVTVDAPNAAITLDGGKAKTTTGIIADSSAALSAGANAGTGGDVIVDGKTLVLLHGAQISASSETAGAGGSVLVTVGGDILLQNSSEISVVASAAGVNAGSLYVNTPGSIQISSQSSITANASGSGGDIYIGYQPPTPTPAVTRSAGSAKSSTAVGLVLLNGGNIVAQAKTGNGGQIRINANALLQSTGSIISAATPNRKAIQGIVFETNPSQDLAGQLAVLPNGLLSLDATLQDVCAQRLHGNFSSFILGGQGGMPIEPGGWLPGVMTPGQSGSFSFSDSPPSKSPVDPGNTLLPDCCGGHLP